MRIAFIHSALAFYRIPLFNALSRKFGVEYFFQTKLGSPEELLRFKFKVLKGIPLPNLPDYKIPPKLFFHLIKGRFSMFIGAGAAQLDTMIAFFVAKLLSKPFILWNVLWFYNSSIISRIRYPVWRYIVLNSDALILPGKKSKEFHLALGVNENRIFLSPNTSELKARDLKAESVTRLKKSLGYKNENTIVLCFTRISPEKGLEYLIESYKFIDNDSVKILVATTIPPEKKYFNELYDLAKTTSRDNIKLKVFQQSQKSILFQLCDIFVLPSIWRKDVGPDMWGMVLNEALSVGKPLIATTSVGGAFDMIVPGKNGYIVKSRDSKQLGMSINKIINSGNLEKMGRFSRALQEKRFRLKHEVNGFVEAYNHVKLIEKSCKQVQGIGNQ